MRVPVLHQSISTVLSFRPAQWTTLSLSPCMHLFVHLHPLPSPSCTIASSPPCNGDCTRGWVVFTVTSCPCDRFDGRLRATRIVAPSSPTRERLLRVPRRTPPPPPSTQTEGREFFLRLHSGGLDVKCEVKSHVGRRWWTRRRRCVRRWRRQQPRERDARVGRARREHVRGRARGSVHEGWRHAPSAG